MQRLCRICVSLCLALILAISASASSGTEYDWYDRIGTNMPDYAVNLYNWLKTASAENGALYCDCSKGTYDGVSTVYDQQSGATQIIYTFTKKEITANTTDYQAEINNIVANNASYNNEVQNYAKAVFFAFKNDCPEVFWITNGCSTGYRYNFSVSTSDNKNFTIKGVYTAYLVLDSDSGTPSDTSDDYNIRLTEYVGKDGTVAEYAAIRDTAIETIKAAITADDTYGKLVQINNWLTGHNKYYNEAPGTESPKSHNALSALVGSTGTECPVCEGYAKAFKVICGEFGIPCVLINGCAYDSAADTPEAHMWDAVKLGDKWYAVDATWNDPISEAEGVVSGLENENFLLVGSSTVIDNMTFTASHINDSCLTGSSGEVVYQYTDYPTLAEIAYDNTAVNKVNNTVNDKTDNTVNNTSGSKANNAVNTTANNKTDNTVNNTKNSQPSL